ncbi:MAG: hypothetical protein ACFE9C_07995 [Candidatus Hodarchaeota archaeon]
MKKKITKNKGIKIKRTDYNKSADNAEFNEFPPITKKNQFYSNYLDNIIKNLSTPRFLGSIHMKKTSSPNNSIENLVENDLNLKTTKVLKNTLFNPLTKILIILAIVFNIVWFLLSAIF